MDGGAPNAVKESFTCRPYTDWEGLIVLPCITGGAICDAALLEDAGIVVAGVLLTRLRRNTITPKSNNTVSSIAPITIAIQGIAELSDAGCVEGWEFCAGCV